MDQRVFENISHSHRNPKGNSLCETSSELTSVGREKLKDVNVHVRNQMSNVLIHIKCIKNSKYLILMCNVCVCVCVGGGVVCV